MNDDARLERLFADALAQAAPARAPERLRIDIKTTVRQTRPRPRWLALLKEPPMHLDAAVAVGSPMARLSSTPTRRAVWIMLMVALSVAVAAAAIVVGSRLLRDADPNRFNSGLVVPTLALDQTWDKTTNPALAINSRIAIGPDGNLYVVSSVANEILVMDPDGTLVRRWGERGTGDGQFDFVTNGNWNIDVGGIAVAPGGDVYVADTFNRRIQQFDPTGRFVRTWGTYGTDDGQFLVPLDVAVATDGSVLVVDAARGDVQRFSAEGEMLGILPGGGAHDGVQDHATGTRTEANGTIYDVDLASGWLNSWMPDGSFRSSLLSGGTGSASLSMPFLAAPTNTAFDAEGNIYLTEGDRLLVFTPTGELSSTWVAPAPSDGGWMPIAVASDGTVYLSAGTTIYKLRVADRTPVPEASNVVATVASPAPALAPPSPVVAIPRHRVDRAFPLAFSIDLPPGWLPLYQEPGLVELAAAITGGPSDFYDRSVKVMIVMDTSVDPCQEAPVPQEPPTGPGVDDLVNALATQAQFHLVGPITDTSVDGFPGLTFQQEALVDPAMCPDPDNQPLRRWTYAAPETEPDAWDLTWADAHERISVVDVRGTRVLVVARTHPSASADQVRETNRIFDSIDFE